MAGFQSCIVSQVCKIVECSSPVPLPFHPCLCKCASGSNLALCTMTAMIGVEDARVDVKSRSDAGGDRRKAFPTEVAVPRLIPWRCQCQAGVSGPVVF